MEFLEIPEHKFFVATQAHPEFTSRPLRPNPMFLGFVEACSGEAPKQTQKTFSAPKLELSFHKK